MSKRIGLDILLTTVMMAVVMIMNSCIEEGPKTYEGKVVSVTPMTLDLRPSYISFYTYQASTQTVQVTSTTDVAWEFVGIPSWVTVKPRSGRGSATVQISCTQNEDTNNRISFMTFRSVNTEWNYSTNVTVSQVRTVYTAIPDQEVINVSWTQSQVVVNVQANNDEWSVIVPPEMQSWCNATKSNKSVIIHCTENTSKNKRSGQIKIQTPDGSHTITIEQSGIKFDVTSDSTALYFSDQSGVASIYVNTYSNVQWTASATEDWIAIAPTNGKGNGSIDVYVTENELDSTRRGWVNVYTQDDVTSIAVIQSGKYLTVSSKDLVFGSTGGDLQVSLKTNDGWRASTNRDWIELSQSSGTTDCNLVLTVEDNNTSYSRMGYVMILPEHSNPVMLNVVQNGRYLTPSDSVAIFFWGDTVKTIRVNTDGKYTVKENCSWLNTEIKDSKLILSLTDNIDRTETLIDSVSLTLTGLDDGSLTRKITVVVRGLTDSYVDLGLSVKWATCNVGAFKSEDYGDYFAWGETEPYYVKSGFWASNGAEVTWREDKPDGYYWSSYYDYHDDTFIRHNLQGSTSLYDYEDVARVLWGKEWRMPTKEEFRELLNDYNCTWTLTTLNGINGYLVTSKVAGYEDNSIFLPFNGYRLNKELTAESTEGYYWTSSMYTESYHSYAAYNLFLDNSTPAITGVDRYRGFAIRPVRLFDGSDVSSITLNYSVLNLARGDAKELIATGKKKDANQNTLRMVLDWTSTDTTVATVVDGLVYAKAEGSCIIEGSLPPYTVKCDVTVKEPYNSDKEREWVDLGLSVKWATVNVGAIAPEGNGDYFAWGETEPYYIERGSSLRLIWKEDKSEGYAAKSYFDYDANTYSYLKYNNQEGKTILEPEDDAAHVKWGGGWRIPSDEECRELIYNCDLKYISINGVEGYSVISKVQGYENHSIFLPITGVRMNSILFYGSRYWCNRLYTSASGSAYTMSIYSSNDFNINYATRTYGLPIRAVCAFTIDDVKSIELSSDELNLTPGSKMQLTTCFIKQDGKQLNTFIDTLVWYSNDKSVATVVDGVVTAVGPGTCEITVSLNDITSVCTVNVLDPDDVKHDYVDLGLSVQWATFNVGAFTPEMFGDYYAWGEISTYYKPGTIRSDNPEWVEGKEAGYSWSSYFDYIDNGFTFRKYYSDGGKTSLDISDDVAHVKWGGGWRIPTYSEMSELMNNCNWEWTQINGVDGFVVSGTKPGYENNSIFLPICGYCDANQLYISSSQNNNYGFYWTSDLYGSSSSNASILYLYSGSKSWSYISRSNGLSVRPVCLFYASALKDIELNYNQFKLTPDAKLNLLVSGIKPDNTVVSVSMDSVIWSSDNSSVAEVSNGLVTAVGVGSCTITASIGSYYATCLITVVDPDAYPPQMVDLGLSVKWATFNVGAYSPEMFGDYFAWGESDTYYKYGESMMRSPVWKNGKEGGYKWSSYSYCDNATNTITKYCDSPGQGNNGYVDNVMTLAPEDDVAHVKWGGSWRMPTFNEMRELTSNTIWTWTAVEGIKGFLLKSNVEGYEDRSIFLPAAGYFTSENTNVGIYGKYWTSALTPGNANYAYYLSFYMTDIHNYMNTDLRYKGLSVRPVIPFDNTDIDRVELDDSISKVKLIPGEPYQLSATVYKKDGHKLNNVSLDWDTDNHNVAIVSADGLVTAVGAGQCTLSVDLDGVYTTCDIEVVDMDAIVPEYVDMGLSVKWATFNVGAYSPEVIGDYYAWGETDTHYEAGQAWVDYPRWKSGKTEGYDWSNYYYCRGSSSTLTKYCFNGGYGNNGYSDTRTTLEEEDDVAHVKWGGSWRMPTRDEFDELRDNNNCTWTWTTVNNVSGYLITSKKAGYEDRSIFLPSTGYRSYTYYYNRYNYGNYWTSSLDVDKGTTTEASAMYFYSYGRYLNNYDRSDGLCVRPVCP